MASDEYKNKLEYLKLETDKPVQILILEPIDVIVNDQTGTYTFYGKWNTQTNKWEKFHFPPVPFNSPDPRPKDFGFSFKFRCSVVHDKKLKIFEAGYSLFKELKYLKQLRFDFSTSTVELLKTGSGKETRYKLAVGAVLPPDMLVSLQSIRPVMFKSLPLRPQYYATLPTVSQDVKDEQQFTEDQIPF